MHCPLCGFEFDEKSLACSARCPLAAVQGCSLVCCPNCGYQMVDERKSGLAKLLRRTWQALSQPGHARKDQETLK